MDGQHVKFANAGRKNVQHLDNRVPHFHRGNRERAGGKDFLTALFNVWRMGRNNEFRRQKYDCMEIDD